MVFHRRLQWGAAVVVGLALGCVATPAFAATPVGSGHSHGHGNPHRTPPGHARQGAGAMQVLSAPSPNHRSAVTSPSVSTVVLTQPNPAPVLPALAATAPPLPLAAPTTVPLRVLAPVGRISLVAAVSAPVPVPVAARITPVEAPPVPTLGARVTPALEGFPNLVLPPGAEGTRLSLALALLPLLIGIWLWALARGSVAAWRVRNSRTRELLAQQLGIPVGDLVSLRDSGLLRLRDQVAIDELTGVACRAAGMAALERELSSARREQAALSVAFIDVDGLKATNDSLGHEAGDHLLQGVARILSGRLRGHDIVFRFGGDEFVCVLAATAGRDADAICQDLRARAGRAGMSFSYGIAEVRDGETSDELLARADSRLYEDKRARSAQRG